MPRLNVRHTVVTLVRAKGHRQMNWGQAMQDSRLVSIQVQQGPVLHDSSCNVSAKEDSLAKKEPAVSDIGLTAIG